MRCGNPHQGVAVCRLFELTRTLLSTLLVNCESATTLLVRCMYTRATQDCQGTNMINPAFTLHLLPLTSVVFVTDPPPLPSLLPCCIVTPSICREVTSRANQSSKARSEAQLKYVALNDEEIFQFFWRRFSHVCLNVPAADNFYLSWYMQGAGHCDLAQRQDFYPPYLRKKSFQKLKVTVRVCRHVIHMYCII